MAAGTKYRTDRRARRAKPHQHVIISTTSAPQRLVAQGMSSGAIAHSAWQPVQSRTESLDGEPGVGQAHQHAIILATSAPQRLVARENLIASGGRSGTFLPRQLLQDLGCKGVTSGERIPAFPSTIIGSARYSGSRDKVTCPPQ